MQIPFFWIDAFSPVPFGGNPAAVCVLEQELSGKQMQRMAAQHGLSETAFVQRQENGLWSLRWFTPAVEVDLCGHATLASGHVLLNEGFVSSELVEFETRSGRLTVRRGQERGLRMRLPRRNPEACDPAPGMLEALGAQPEAVYGAEMYLAVYRDEDEVRQLRPNMDGLMELDRDGVIVTAPGREVDFVSRYFVPAQGIPEDPVTGSAHCISAPYWAGRLGRTRLKARQLSARGGELSCEVEESSVVLEGAATTYIRGELKLPG